jgi:hypothetical protein
MSEQLPLKDWRVPVGHDIAGPARLFHDCNELCEHTDRAVAIGPPYRVTDDAGRTVYYVLATTQAAAERIGVIEFQLDALRSVKPASPENIRKRRELLQEMRLLRDAQ